MSNDKRAATAWVLAELAFGVGLQFTPMQNQFVADVFFGVAFIHAMYALSRSRAFSAVRLERPRMAFWVAVFVGAIGGATLGAILWTLHKAESTYKTETKVETTPPAPAVARPFSRRTSDEVLRRLFPDGFVLFELDERKQVFPYTSHLDERKYRFDWSAIRLTTSGDRYELRGPNVFVDGWGPITAMMSGSLSHDRALLSAGAPFAGMSGMSMTSPETKQNNLAIHVAVVGFSEYGPVYVVGFESHTH